MLSFFILEKERREGGDGERERETSICCCIYLHIYWLLLVCALTVDRTHNIGIRG